MDLRLLFPAIGLWIGVAATFFFTGQDPDPVVRNASAKLVFTLLVLGIAVFVAWLLVIWRMRPVELQSNVLRVRGIFTVFVFLGCVVSALQISAQSSDPLASWINEKPVAQISGVISTEVQTRATSTAAVWKAPEMRVVSLASEEITVGEATYSIELPFTVEVDAGVVIPPPGTSVVITGKLGQSYRYGNFAAGVSSVELIEVVGEPGFVDALAHTMRGGLSTALAGIDDRGGPLVAGLAIGDESALPPELKDQMRLSGLAHLTAVSGGNVAIVLAMVILVSMLLGIRLLGRVALSLGALVFYVILVQPQPSVVRAATMGAIVVIAFLVGGRTAGPSILSTAVIILLIFDPSLGISWGFALSVCATGGLVVLTPILLDYAQKTQILARTPPVILAAALLTIAAQIATLPVLIAMGTPIGLGSVPANILAMPMVPFITVGGLLSSLASLVSPELAAGLALVSSWPAIWIANLASFFSEWPTLSGIGVLLALAVVGLVVGVAWYLSQPLIAIGAVVVFLLFTVLQGADSLPWKNWPGDSWTLVMCDVGQGDGLVLRDRSGAVIVFDVGGDAKLIDHCLRELGVTEVSAIVLTHYHRDHVGGIAGVLRGRDVGQVIATGYHEPKEQFDYVLKEIPLEIPQSEVTAGQEYSLGGIDIKVLWPARYIREGSIPNNASVVVLATIEGRVVLLTGDIEREAQAAIMREAEKVDVDIVKIPHHGSANLDQGFADWANAEIALISVGQDNDYGHPAAEALAQWSESQIYRTDQDGAVSFSLSEEGVWSALTQK
ncbi:MAG: DNA internalization-related competence protein ComEC/Rec2 [Actinomycetia bacterium]|nr:DNA internalization-related competence protein ComEC/Rec2 [Actinomycetes bacterium]